MVLFRVSRQRKEVAAQNQLAEQRVAVKNHLAEQGVAAKN
jgi:hypothetical protein